jgi:hypothetical protein
LSCCSAVLLSCRSVVLLACCSVVLHAGLLYSVVLLLSCFSLRSLFASFINTLHVIQLFCMTSFGSLLLVLVAQNGFKIFVKGRG